MLMDDQECRFNINSYKKVYVVDGEFYLYKRYALAKAQKVVIFCLSAHHVFCVDEPTDKQLLFILDS